MAHRYSPQTIQQLTDAYAATGVVRPMRIARYEGGTELAYEVTGVAPAHPGRMRVQVEKFVGGGFAGQVYRVKLLELDAPDGPIGYLTVGDSYAMKILIPPSRGSHAFRNMIYAVGFQAAFQLTCNPTASRAGALWQTLIRRAAAVRFGDERAVTEIHATFVDPILGSCGEISEWIDGRTWRFEADEHLGLRRSRRRHATSAYLSSPEYLAKKDFMAEIVDLLHDMGAPELARQYEWWTCKSQPNCLKRLDSNDDPQTGLTAVDFRAGLALLPFLPMSPGDVVLIAKGIARGSLVQFDRGNLRKLRAFVDTNAQDFTDLTDAVDELQAAETHYRDSQIDLTHNLPRLLTSPRLWRRLTDSTVEGWRVRNITDDAATGLLQRHRFLTPLFALLNLAPVASLVGGLVILLSCLLRWRITLTDGVVGAALVTVVPGYARWVRSLLGRADMRRHYGRMLTSPSYFWQAVRAHMIEGLIAWHRARRLDKRHVQSTLTWPALYPVHRALSLLPRQLHRFLSDPRYIAGVMRYVVVRPLKLLFNAKFREAWMRSMIRDGCDRGMLTPAEARQIESRIDDPYIQKYIKSLAVHVCTLPITQVVSVLVAAIAVIKHPEWSMGEAWGYAMTIIGVFQIIPISPGSITRGLYVVYLVIRDRDFKHYNIAVFMSFFKYIGYLAFPIQMAQRYPTLSRFMAGRGATGAVSMIPVFGERGALLEHGVFDLFFNYPLTLRRRRTIIRKRRASLPTRVWHMAPLALLGVAAFSLIDWRMLVAYGHVPQMRTIWYATIAVPLLLGSLVARWAGGAKTTRRIVIAIEAGIVMGLLNSICHSGWHLYSTGVIDHVGELRSALSATNTGDLLARFLRHAFSFAVFAAIGAFLTETFVREPKANGASNGTLSPDAPTG